MKEVMIVGANGFIGNFLEKSLTKHGHQTTRIVRNSKITKIDENIIFYVAGSTTPNNSSNADVDSQSLKNLLNKLRSLKDRPLFVYASSAGTIYDPSVAQPYEETSPLSPTNSYGHTKLQHEKIVLESEWVDPLILRLSNIYGPYQKPRPGFGVIANWVYKICMAQPIEMIGNSVRDYLHISDLSELALKIASGTQSLYAGKIINVGSGNVVSLEELYEVFSSTLGQRIEVDRIPTRSCDRDYFSIDVSLAKKLFNWESKTSLAEGIRSVMDAAKKN